MALFNNWVSPLWMALPGVLWKCYLEPRDLQRHLPCSIWQCNHQPELFHPVSDLTHLHFDSVCCSPLPAPTTPYPPHSCSLKRRPPTTKGAAMEKKKWGKRNNPRQTNKSREEALELRLIMLYYGFHGHASDSSVSALRFEEGFVYSVPGSCAQSNLKHGPLSQAVECVLKNVHRTQAHLILASKICLSECSCCWS